MAAAVSRRIISQFNSSFVHLGQDLLIHKVLGETGRDPVSLLDRFRTQSRF
jgi:hypothetical protein